MIRRSTLLLTCGMSLALGFAWLHAQDNSEAVPEDKWAQIRENHQQMLKSLEMVEQNLNFVKARSMRGGSSH